MPGCVAVAKSCCVTLNDGSSGFRAICAETAVTAKAASSESKSFFMSGSFFGGGVSVVVQHKSIYAKITKLQLKCAAIITFCHKSSENLLVCKLKVYIIPPRPPQGREPDMLGRQLPVCTAFPVLHCPPGSPLSSRSSQFSQFAQSSPVSSRPNRLAVSGPGVCRLSPCGLPHIAGQGEAFRRARGRLSAKATPGAASSTDGAALSTDDGKKYGVSLSRFGKKHYLCKQNFKQITIRIIPL